MKKGSLIKLLKLAKEVEKKNHKLEEVFGNYVEIGVLEQIIEIILDELEVFKENKILYFKNEDGIHRHRWNRDTYHDIIFSYLWENSINIDKKEMFFHSPLEVINFITKEIEEIREYQIKEDDIND